MKKTCKSLSCVVLPVAFGLCLAPVAQAGSEAFALCAKNFPDNGAERLKCFDDALLAPVVQPLVTVQPIQQPQLAEAKPVEDTPAANETPVTAPERSYLTKVWDLDNGFDRDQGVLGLLQPHRQSYIIVRKTSNANNMPTSPSPGHSVLTPDSVQSTEAKYQLSFKTGIFDLKNIDLLGFNSFRLWGAYTQQSNWQVFNNHNSAPFRETNYEPELIGTFATGNESGWKLLNLGFSHQSNGRPLPTSRSWNRGYVQGGWEWDTVSVLARSWWRIPEAAAKDDNPDITHYVGRADMVLRWEPVDKSQAVSVLLRNNLNWNKNLGFVQVDWSQPIVNSSAVRWHVQFTSGYGESLIDYNQRQTTLGAGISFREW